MSGNKMALDALMACVAAIERTQHCTLEDRLAASDKARAAIAALQAEEVERLAAQAAPTKISEFPEDYDGLAHLYIQACEERDHLRAVLAAQPSQAPVVQASTDANHVSISNAFNTGGGTLMGAAGLDADNVSAAPVQTVQATPKLLEDLKLWAEQNQGAYLIPDWDGNRVLRHLNAATTAQAVRMLTKEELTDLIASTVAALTKGQP